MTIYGNPELHRNNSKKEHKWLTDDIFSYERLETKEIEHLDIPVIHIYDLKYSNLDDDKYISVPGPVFLVPKYMPYYHVVADLVAYYEFLKEEYQDLRMVYCATQISREIELNLEEPYPHLIQFWDWPGGWMSVDFHKANYHFEHVITLPSDSVWRDDRKVPYEIQQSIKEFSYEECMEPRPMMLEGLKKKIIGEIDDNAQDKIYLTRTSRNPRKKRDRDMSQDQKAELRARTYPDEKILEDYFVSRGFYIVDTSNLNITDQANIIAKAKVVAGIGGTNMFNAIWTRPGTKVIYIHTSSYWAYNYQMYFDFFNLNVSHVARDDCNDAPFDPDWKMPVEKIIEYLDELDMNVP